MGINQWALGGCDCPTGIPCSCYPCNLPKNNLSIAYSNPTYGNSSATLVYGGSCSWTACWNVQFPDAFVVSGSMDIHCTGLCTYYRVRFYDGLNCTGTPTGYVGYDHPTGCGPYTGIGLISSTCSPLNILLASQPTPPWTSYTITP